MYLLFLLIERGVGKVIRESFRDNILPENIGFYPRLLAQHLARKEKHVTFSKTHHCALKHDVQPIRKTFQRRCSLYHVSEAIWQEVNTLLRALIHNRRVHFLLHILGHLDRKVVREKQLMKNKERKNTTTENNQMVMLQNYKNDITEKKLCLDFFCKDLFNNFVSHVK